MLVSTLCCSIKLELRLDGHAICCAEAILMPCTTHVQVSQALLKLWQGCCTGDLSELQRLRMAQHPSQSAAMASVSQVLCALTMLCPVNCGQRCSTST